MSTVSEREDLVQRNPIDMDLLNRLLRLRQALDNNQGLIDIRNETPGNSRYDYLQANISSRLTSLLTTLEHVKFEHDESVITIAATALYI